MGGSGRACPQLRMTAVTTATSGRTGPTLEPEAIRPSASCRSSGLRQLAGTVQAGGERSRSGRPTEQCDHQSCRAPAGDRAGSLPALRERRGVFARRRLRAGAPRNNAMRRLRSAISHRPRGARGARAGRSRRGRRGQLHGHRAARPPVPRVGAYIYRR